MHKWYLVNRFEASKQGNRRGGCHREGVCQVVCSGFQINDILFNLQLLQRSDLSLFYFVFRFSLLAKFFYRIGYWNQFKQTLF
jgi:hypothetical protein